MRVRLKAYGIARDLIGHRELVLDFSGSDIGQLREELIRLYPDFRHLRSLSFAVGDHYRNDDFPLQNDTEVVIIPPVSGG